MIQAKLALDDLCRPRPSERIVLSDHQDQGGRVSIMLSAGGFHGDAANHHHWPWRRFLVWLATEPALAGEHALNELNGHIQFTLGFLEDRLKRWMRTGDAELCKQLQELSALGHGHLDTAVHGVLGVSVHECSKKGRDRARPSGSAVVETSRLDGASSLRASILAPARSACLYAGDPWCGGGIQGGRRVIKPTSYYL